MFLILHAMHCVNIFRTSEIMLKYVCENYRKTVYMLINVGESMFFFNGSDPGIRLMSVFLVFCNNIDLIGYNKVNVETSCYFYSHLISEVSC